MADFEIISEPDIREIIIFNNLEDYNNTRFTMLTDRLLYFAPSYWREYCVRFVSKEPKDIEEFPSQQNLFTYYGNENDIWKLSKDGNCEIGLSDILYELQSIYQNTKITALEQNEAAKKLAISTKIQILKERGKDMRLGDILDWTVDYRFKPKDDTVYCYKHIDLYGLY